MRTTWARGVEEQVSQLCCERELFLNTMAQQELAFQITPVNFCQPWWSIASDLDTSLLVAKIDKAPSF